VAERTRDILIGHLMSHAARTTPDAVAPDDHRLLTIDAVYGLVAACLGDRTAGAALGEAGWTAAELRARRAHLNDRRYG
jgi:hypothetical protein